MTKPRGKIPCNNLISLRATANPLQCLQSHRLPVSFSPGHVKLWDKRDLRYTVWQKLGVCDFSYLLDKFWGYNQGVLIRIILIQYEHSIKPHSMAHWHNIKVSTKSQLSIILQGHKEESPTTCVAFDPGAWWPVVVTDAHLQFGCFMFMWISTGFTARYQSSALI